MAGGYGADADALQSACDWGRGRRARIRVDRRLLNWGVFLVALGAVPLAVRGGVVPADVRWVDLWPLLLVGAGLGLLLQASRLAAVGGIVIALTFGLLVGGALSSGFGVALGCGQDGRSFATAHGSLGGRASVSVELGCGRLAVTTAPGAGWSLSGTSDDGQPPRIESAPDRLAIQPRSSGFVDFAHGGTWSVTLPSDPSLDVDATVNAGEATIGLAGSHPGDVSLTVNAGRASVDLSGTTPGTLEARVNAGSLTIRLPSASLAGSLTTNAGSLVLCRPADAAVRVQTGGGVLAGYDFGAAGLVQNGSVWESPDFASAANRIDLSATANAGSISLKPSEGCA